MIDEFTKKDIEKISYELLKSSKSLDVFPTPVESILNYSDFVADNKIDLLNIKHSFFEKFKDSSIKILQSGISKVKGIFDRREKTIYIDIGLDKNLGKKNFVQLHEIGHGVLGWQNEMMLCLDNDDTLSPEIEEQFEQEANYFASITLFQHDRFIQEAEKLNLGLTSVMVLGKKFGASVHATLRNYVLNSKNRCALLVLNHPVNENGYVNILTTRDLFYSSTFLKEFGGLNLPEEFGFKWAFVQDYKFNKRFNDKGSISLVTLDGEELKANYHFFNSTYNSFVFIFPKGEKNRSKTKVVLS